MLWSGQQQYPPTLPSLGDRSILCCLPITYHEKKILMIRGIERERHHMSWKLDIFIQFLKQSTHTQFHFKQNKTWIFRNNGIDIYRVFYLILKDTTSIHNLSKLGYQGLFFALCCAICTSYERHLKKVKSIQTEWKRNYLILLENRK